MFRQARRRDAIGFAFSGGGSRGAVQAGMVRAMEEAGIRPQIIVGTSAGAVNAGWLALHPDRPEALGSIWSGLRTRDIFPGGPVRMLMNLARGGYAHAADSWEAFLRQHLGRATFEDCRVTLAIVAVRLSDGERVVFRDGEIVPAIMASTAIPGGFPPYRIGDELYVDGGVLEYLPVPTALELGATTIYAFDCSWIEHGECRISSVTDRSARIAAQHYADRIVRLPTEKGVAIHLMRPPIPEFDDARNFRFTAEMLRGGYEYARDFIADRRGDRHALGTASGKG